MAFPLFPKSPGKDKAGAGRAKPELSPRHDARGNSGHAPVSAREVAASVKGRPPAPTVRPPSGDPREITVTGPSSLIDLSPGTQQGIEVAEANPGLCAVLENAALLYANAQAAQARQVLEQGVAEDNDAKLSPLAWLALFDLLQRANDRAVFDQLALQYVVAFERSAPAWEERGPQQRPGARASPGGYFALTGKLSAANAPQIEHMLLATQKQSQVRLDLGSLTGADDTGAKLLATALAQVRKRQYVLALQHPEKIRRALEGAVKQGRDAGEGYWMLLLELLQWQNDRAAFEDRAVDFAVTFELSPPSWEPPPESHAAAAPAGAPAAEADRPETLAFQGTMTGSSDPQLAKFAEFREGRSVVPIDMAAVERVDFVCAGALLNAINRAEGQRKTVQIAGASPIIRALLLLIGISPRHFIKTVQ
ncbi:MAG: STAS domain-containing protein [Betaproteobacteria bacterium]|nr:MAG: STAS domain-containing protein [Betaproteobacteria bacterium]